VSGGQPCPDTVEVYRWPDGSRIVRFLNDNAYMQVLHTLHLEFDPLAFPKRERTRQWEAAQFVWPVASIDIQEAYNRALPVSGPTTYFSGFLLEAAESQRPLAVLSFYFEVSLSRGDETSMNPILDEIFTPFGLRIENAEVRSKLIDFLDAVYSGDLLRRSQIDHLGQARVVRGRLDEHHWRLGLPYALVGGVTIAPLDNRYVKRLFDDVARSFLKWPGEIRKNTVIKAARTYIEDLHGWIQRGRPMGLVPFTATAPRTNPLRIFDEPASTWQRWTFFVRSASTALRDLDLYLDLVHEEPTAGRDRPPLYWRLWWMPEHDQEDFAKGDDRGDSIELGYDEDLIKLLEKTALITTEERAEQIVQSILDSQPQGEFVLDIEPYLLLDENPLFWDARRACEVLPKLLETS